MQGLEKTKERKVQVIEANKKGIRESLGIAFAVVSLLLVK